MTLTAEEQKRVEKLCSHFGHSPESATEMVIKARQPSYDSFGGISFRPATGDGRCK